MKPKPESIDEYLATVSADNRPALERLRKTIKAAIPKAEECFSYGLPAFRLNGKVVAGFSEFKSHCSYFPFSGKTIATLAEELEGYEKSSGAIRFDPHKPLPVALVRKLIKTRIKETEGTEK